MSAEISCGQCQATMIQGQFCHETDCPNCNKTYEDGEWVAYRQCYACGCDVRVGEECDCTWSCPECGEYSEHGCICADCMRKRGV